jgi:hypothetical protein
VRFNARGFNAKTRRREGMRIRAFETRSSRRATEGGIGSRGVRCVCVLEDDVGGRGEGEGRGIGDVDEEGLSRRDAGADCGVEVALGIADHP